MEANPEPRRPSAQLALRLEWSNQADGLRFQTALLSLFGYSAEAVRLLGTSTWRDVDPPTAARALSSGSGIARIHLDATTELELDAARPGTLRLSPPEVVSTRTDPTWFQADPGIASPVPLLAAPLVPGGIDEELLHGLVGLARRCGLTSAALESGSSASVRWNTDGPGAPVVATAHGARWTRTLNAEKAALYVEGLPDRHLPTADLIEQLRVQLLKAPNDYKALDLLLQAAVPTTPLQVAALQQVAGPFHVQPSNDCCLRLLPAVNHVRVEVDVDLPADEAAAEHPRPGPRFLIRVSSDQLANRAIRLFKQEYEPAGGVSSRPKGGGSYGNENGVDWLAALRARGRLSEVRLEDSSLGLVGVLDQVSLHGDDVVVTDFKSGKPKDEHQRQLRRYAVLWEAATGVAPAKLVAQYLNGRSEWPVSEGEVKAARSELTKDAKRAAELLAKRPAPARPGAECRWCPVRARCDKGWELAESATRTTAWRDIEVVITGATGPHGFVGKDRAGKDIAVVHEPPVASLLAGPLRPGLRLRLVGCKRGSEPSEVEVKAWSEAFVVGGP